MTGQEDQGGARAGEVTPKEAKQPQTRQGLNLGQLKEIPHFLKLLYIPASPCPDHDHSTNPGHHSALNFQTDQIPHHIIADHLQFFISNWKILTGERWIHNTIQGFHIPLHSPPKQTSPQEWALPKDNREVLNQELHELLKRNIITPVTDNKFCQSSSLPSSPS